MCTLRFIGGPQESLGIKHITQSFPSSCAPWPNPNPNLILCFPAPPKKGDQEPVSWKFQELFGPAKLFCVHRIYIQDQSFNNFDNDAVKLSVNEAKWTVLWATGTVLLFNKFDFKICFRPFEKRAPGAPWWGKGEFKRGTAAIIVKGHYFFSLMAQCFTSDCDSNVSVTGP